MPSLLDISNTWIIENAFTTMAFANHGGGGSCGFECPLFSPFLCKYR
jgi:hypothetical protein